MTNGKIKSPEDLTKVLIEVGIYLLEHGVGEIDVSCGKLRVKAVIDLINREDITE